MKSQKYVVPGGFEVGRLLVVGGGGCFVVLLVNGFFATDVHVVSRRRNRLEEVDVPPHRHVLRMPQQICVGRLGNNTVNRIIIKFCKS